MAKYESPLSGICTFARFPYIENTEEIKGGVAIVGYPMDMTSCWRTGSRWAPKRIREASMKYDLSQEGFFDIERNREYLKPGTVNIVDAGDVPIITGDIYTSMDLCEKTIRTLVNNDVVPVIIGGDHATTIPVERGLDKFDDICIIQFDAHLDWSDAPGGQKYSHSSPMRRASELPMFTKMAQIGLRGLGSSRKSDFDAAKEFGSVIIPAREAKRIGAKEVVNRIPDAKHYYITMDMDGFDTSYARGTGSPAPGGLEYDLLLDILEGIAGKGKVIGFDIVEVNPPCDPAGITENVAAEIILRFLGFIFG